MRNEGHYHRPTPVFTNQLASRKGYTPDGNEQVVPDLSLLNTSTGRRTADDVTGRCHGLISFALRTFLAFFIFDKTRL